MALTIQELSDREEIRETILRWSRAVDTSDWDLLRQSYTEDAVTDFRVLGIRETSGPAVQAYLESVDADYTAMHHLLSNITFHEVVEDYARTSTLVYATVVPKNAQLFHIGAWYHDELGRTADGWRIRTRKAEFVFWDGVSSG
jgi:ketosteroid isomerase-like protein